MAVLKCLAELRNMAYDVINKLNETIEQHNDTIEEQNKIINEQNSLIESLKGKTQKGHKIKTGEKIAFNNKYSTERMKELYSHGVQPTAIAKEIGCPVITVRRRLGLNK